MLIRKANIDLISKEIHFRGGKSKCNIRIKTRNITSKSIEAGWNLTFDLPANIEEV